MVSASQKLMAVAVGLAALMPFGAKAEIVTADQTEPPCDSCSARHKGKLALREALAATREQDEKPPELIAPEAKDDGS